VIGGLVLSSQVCRNFDYGGVDRYYPCKLFINRTAALLSKWALTDSDVQYLRIMMVNMDKLKYEKQNYHAEQSCAGLIVLQTDEVVETEVRAWLPDTITLYHTRISNEDNITEDTLLAMRKQIPAACEPMIGESIVEQGVKQVFPSAKVTNPITAVKAQLTSLNAKNIGLLTPYIPSVTQAMSDHLREHGFNIVSAASFYEENDFNVCRISSHSIEKAVEHIVTQARCEAVFASCTNLRTLNILDSMSKKHGVPVISSNAALAWHIAELSSLLKP